MLSDCYFLESQAAKDRLNYRCWLCGQTLPAGYKYFLTLKIAQTWMAYMKASIGHFPGGAIEEKLALDDGTVIWQRLESHNSKRVT